MIALAVVVAASCVATAPAKGLEDDWWERQWRGAVANRSKVLSDMLAAYPIVSRAQRDRGHGGKFVTIVADRHGLGNRIGPIVGAFALALATNRSLAIHWPHTRCSTHKNRKECDPAGVDDLFEKPPGVEWHIPNGHKLPGLCSHGPWMINGNGQKDVEKILTTKGLGRGEKFRETFKNFCTDSDRDFSWGLSCHPELRDVVFPSPWVTSGILANYLLRPNRYVMAKIAKAEKRHGVQCALAIHLRKSDQSKKKPSKVTTPDLVVAAYEEARNQSGGRRGVYVANDDLSTVTRRYLITALERRTDAILFPPITSGKPTRQSVDGLRDALAENFFLSKCFDIMPRGTGYSTFHDVALARMIFEQSWTQDRVDNFIDTYTTPGPHKFALAPAECRRHSN